MIFGGTTETHSVELGYLAQYTKPVITNLMVKIGADLKLDSQSKAVVKTSFFQNKAFFTKTTI